MTRLRARWIVPVASPPIENGEIEIEGGIVRSIGGVRGPAAPRAASAPGRRDRPAPVVDLGDTILFPSPVNAHTHLEWSWMEGRAPTAHPFSGWVRALLAAPRPDAAEVAAAACRAARSISENGVVAIGNFSSSLEDLPAMRSERLGGVLFVEILGLPAPSAAPLVGRALETLRTAGIDRAGAAGKADLPPALDAIRGALAPHGPHTVSRELLAVAARELSRPGTPIAMHVAESVEETEFLMTGGGPFRDLHESRGGWDGTFRPPGTTPVRYLASLGLLTPRTVAVHCVHVDDDEVALLARARTCVVLCPRSNAWTGAGRAPLEKLLAAGVRCALGTDSLASNMDLDMATELRAARRTWPAVDPAVLLRLATAGGAEVVGLSRRDAPVGVLLPGAVAAISLAALPPGAPAGSDPCAILCGDFGAVRFRPASGGAGHLSGPAGA